MNVPNDTERSLGHAEKRAVKDERDDFVVPPDVDPMPENVDHWTIRSELDSMDRNLIPHSR